MHIKRLPLDTLITGIGRLFKYDDKPWFINLWGESEESKAKYGGGSKSRLKKNRLRNLIK